MNEVRDSWITLFKGLISKKNLRIHLLSKREGKHQFKSGCW